MAAAAACLRYPFYIAQWQELERQALIFKLSNGNDPEPGRCRRTDGKKWRCSRDVAPDQKYCERHMHRSRPRSRKHVEVQTEINNSTITSSVPPTLSANTGSRQLGSSRRPYPQPSVFVSKPDFKSLPLETMSSPTPYKDSRCMEWMLKGDNDPLSNQDFMMQGKANSTTNNTFLQQQYQENNLNSYTDYGTSFDGMETQHQSDDYCLYLNPELEALGPDQRQTPRRFIDAWSTARDNSTGTNKSAGNSNGKLSPSTLSLSMGSDSAVGEDIDQVQMGLGVIDSECDNAGVSKSQPLSWMTPVSWIGSPPGGPLGEVLQSSNTVSQLGSKSACPNSVRNTVSRNSSSSGGLNLMTDDWGGSRDTSPRAMTISSPSGVLHKTVASPSDSSGGNSPTYKAAARTEIALQWMKPKK
ncbi:hypothetical protein AQUCO_07600011v1 [Aquilegia coerulea]|uniref:Growth-regulating factor n=1 Tax=Aquilegia coerulea TaxID=218851 RepID=A0A2G5C8F9_AQUCA|nr:hypothetical protein AQUCO_07600011v1 [Aquilegia coerulea]